LELTDYYTKFVKHYDIIARYLSDLLKKNNFKWYIEAQLTFEALKIAMSTTLVLKLTNFQQTFVIETNTSNEGISAVLMQEKRSIAFLSKKLGVRNQSLSTYEKKY
jgi:RNase H-like domain found in reverse transcriptase